MAELSERAETFFAELKKVRRHTPLSGPVIETYCPSLYAALLPTGPDVVAQLSSILNGIPNSDKLAVARVMLGFAPVSGNITAQLSEVGAENDGRDPRTMRRWGDEGLALLSRMIELWEQGIDAQAVVSLQEFVPGQLSLTVSLTSTKGMGDCLFKYVESEDEWYGSDEPIVETDELALVHDDAHTDHALTVEFEPESDPDNAYELQLEWPGASELRWRLHLDALPSVGSTDVVQTPESLTIRLRRPEYYNRFERARRRQRHR